MKSKKLEIHWSTLFDRDVRRLDYRAASALCASVQSFAAGGKLDGADLRWIETESGLEARLYAAGLYARIEFDSKRPVLYAHRAFAATPHLRVISAPPLLDDPDPSGPTEED